MLGPARWRVVPSVALLFRYSALTFNGHRIHYDRGYCREVEGYPGLVVHGPLSATLLARLAERHAAAPLARFEFRALGPLFDTAPFELALERDGSPTTFVARTPDGTVAVRAVATARDGGSGAAHVDRAASP